MKQWPPGCLGSRVAHLFAPGQNSKVTKLMFPLFLLTVLRIFQVLLLASSSSRLVVATVVETRSLLLLHHEQHSTHPEYSRKVP